VFEHERHHQIPQDASERAGGFAGAGAGALSDDALYAAAAKALEGGERALAVVGVPQALRENHGIFEGHRGALT